MSHEVAEADQNLREIARLRAELDATRADLDTLRNGVAWLGAELDRAKRWGALWKRAAKRGAREWRDLAAAYADMRAENAAVRRAARLLVGAWRQERAAAAEHSINAWRLEGILRGERARRQDAETALLDMRAQKETEQPQ